MTIIYRHRGMDGGKHQSNCGKMFHYIHRSGVYVNPMLLYQVVSATKWSQQVQCAMSSKPNAPTHKDRPGPGAPLIVQSSKYGSECNKTESIYECKCRCALKQKGAPLSYFIGGLC